MAKLQKIQKFQFIFPFNLTFLQVVYNFFSDKMTIYHQKHNKLSTYAETLSLVNFFYSDFSFAPLSFVVNGGG